MMLGFLNYTHAVAKDFAAHPELIESAASNKAPSETEETTGP